MQPIPEYGDHMTLEDFIAAVTDGWFIDYDGTGMYATETGMSDKPARPSDIEKGVIDRSFTHVMWFNK